MIDLIGSDGVLTMVSGQQVTIMPDGLPGHVSVIITPFAGPPTADTGVANTATGVINANAGNQVFLGAGDLASLAMEVENAGTINAANALVQMEAQGGNVAHSGTLISGDLMMKANSDIILEADITTDTAVFDGSVRIGDNGGTNDVLDIVASDFVTFTSTVDSLVGETHDLRIDAGGLATFGDDVGGQDLLLDFDVTGSSDFAGDILVSNKKGVNLLVQLRQ